MIKNSSSVASVTAM